MLVMPIVVLFYNDNGLGMQEVFILQAVYSISIVALEIPSGFFADALGRKNTLVIGSILGFLGFLTYSLTSAFWGFLVAEVILGFGQSMISGADSALLYDSLLSEKREDSYVKYEGRMVSMGNFAEAFAGVLGGLLATISLRTPYFAQTIVALAAVPAALTLFEPKVHEIKLKLGFSEVIKVVRYSLVDNVQLRWNIVFSSVVGASTLSMAWFVQPWFILIGLPKPMFGVMWTLLNLSVGISALYAYRIEQFFGMKITLWVTVVLLSLGFFWVALSSSVWGFVPLFIFYLVRGIATPVLKDYINRYSNSNVRATVLSVRNFAIRIIFSIVGPIYGWATDRLSLSAALTIAGLVLALLSTASLIFMIKGLSPKTILNK
jgi:MFS family permease